LDESSSSWLDSSLSWPPDRIRRCLFSSASSTATLTSAVVCAATGLPSGAPQRPDDRRSEKVIGLSLLFFCCAAPPDVDARTSTPLEEQGSTPPRLRLPRHPGAIIYMEYTLVSTPAATLVPSRRCDCRGISTRRLLPSASATVSSFVVLPLRLREMLECVLLYVSVDGLAPLLGC
jgi:hypothetical protein